MMARPSICLDIDGVMHDLIGTACRKLGIDRDKIVTYNLKECLLTQEELGRLLNEVTNLSIFKQSFKGPTKAVANSLARIGKVADLFVNSCSAKEEINAYKKMILETKYPAIPQQNIVLQLSTAGNKHPIVSDIIIEDWYDSIIANQELRLRMGLNKGVSYLIMLSHNRRYRTFDLLSQGIIPVVSLEDALLDIEKYINNM